MVQRALECSTSDEGRGFALSLSLAEVDKKGDVYFSKYSLVYNNSSIFHRGMRSGTLPHPLVVGIGAACEIAGKEMTYDLEHVRRLSKRLIDGITSQLDFVIRNGDPEMTYEGVCNYHCLKGQ